MKLRKSLAAAAAGVSLLGLAVASPALADTNPGSNTTLAGVGSDTSQDVMEGLSAVVLDGSNNPLISNYKAIPNPRTITTRTGNPNCTFTAPGGSGPGRDALSAAMRSTSFGSPVSSPNMAGCVDFARSSSGGNPTVSPGVGSMTYIPFATDALTFATLNVSNVGHKLAKSDLVSIYSANTPNCIFKPLLPNFGSGTRSFFVTSLGLADVAIGAAGGPGTCVKDVKGGVGIQEHDGRVLTDPDEIVPFSVAQFIAQGSDTVGSLLGRAALGAIDFSASPDASLSKAVFPAALKGTFAFARPIYNVVPTSQIGAGTNTNSVFVGPTSKVCSAQATIEQYGFGNRGDCGDTSKKNTN